MRIDVTEEGGIAYMPGLRKPGTLEGDRLEPGEVERIERLIEAARFFDLPETVGTPGPGAADYQHVRLTIEDRGRRHTVRALVPIENRDLQQLVEAVQGLVRAQRAAARNGPPRSS